MIGLFVTGTDTGVGKTRVAVALIHALRAQGLRHPILRLGGKAAPVRCATADRHFVFGTPRQATAAFPFGFQGLQPAAADAPHPQRDPLLAQGKIRRVEIAREQGLLLRGRASPRHQFDKACGLLRRQRQFELDFNGVGCVHIIVTFGIGLPFIMASHSGY